MPTELLQHAVSYLDMACVDAMAKSCRTLYKATQLAFKAAILRDMPWMWELTGGCEHPESRNWPATWDPLCPPGLEPPEFPVSLENEDNEEGLWVKIVSENPEMGDVANAVKALNRQRREQIRAPHRVKEEAALAAWYCFRAAVEAWICRPPDATVRGVRNWRRVYWLCNPTTTPLPGLLNRARVWDECQEIPRCVTKAKESDEFVTQRESLHDRLKDPSQPGWSTDVYADVIQ